MGVEREASTSLYDLQRSGGRLLTGQGLKSEYSTRATRGYQKLQVSLRFHAEGSVSRKLRVQEVFAELPRFVAHALRGRVSPTLVISCLRVIQWPLGSALTVGLVQRQFGLCC